MQNADCMSKLGKMRKYYHFSVAETVIYYFHVYSNACNNQLLNTCPSEMANQNDIVMLFSSPVQKYRKSYCSHPCVGVGVSVSVGVAQNVKVFG